MKDESLREALRRAAKAEPSAGDPFARFELVRRRSAIARGIVFLGLALAILLGFGLLFPNPLLRGPEGDVPVGGGLDPLPRDVRIYRDAIAGYQLEYPSFWDLVGDEGASVAFYVPVDIDHPSLFTSYTRDGKTLTERPETFYVRVTPRLPGTDSGFIGRGSLDLLSDAGAIIERGSILPEVEDQVRRDQLRVTFGPAPIGERAARVPYWCTGCRLIELTVVLVDRPDVPPLQVRIVAPDATAFNENLFDATEILDAIERLIDDGRVE